MTGAQSKHAVVTLCVGEAFERLAAISHPLLEAYARKISASFEVIRTIKDDRGPYFAKSALSTLLTDYNRVLFVDTDILVAPDCPDLFEAIPEESFAAFFESDLYDRTHSIRIVQESLGDIGWRNGYFNSGVMIASRAHKQVFECPFGFFSDPWFPEQTLYNYNARRFRLPLVPLPMAFNFFAAQGETSGQTLSPFRFGMHMIHYAGRPEMRDAREALMANDAIRVLRLKGYHVKRLLLRNLGELFHRILPLADARWKQAQRGVLRRLVKGKRRA